MQKAGAIILVHAIDVIAAPVSAYPEISQQIFVNRGMAERLQQRDHVHPVPVIIAKIFVFAVFLRRRRTRLRAGKILFKIVVIAVIIVHAIFVALVYNVHVHHCFQRASSVVSVNRHRARPNSLF